MFMNLLAANVNTLSVWEWIVGAILIVLSLIVIFVILLQEGREANLGVISGAADTFLDKGAAKTLDMKLAKWTKVIAISFFVLVLAGALTTKFLSNAALSSQDQASTDSSVSDTVDEQESVTTTTTESGATTTTTGGNTNDAELSW